MQVVTVGRSGENNIVISDDRASRVHLQLVKDDNGGYSVVDLGSTNGTFVNGRRITGEVRLNAGDELRIGSTVLPWQSYFGGAVASSSASRHSGSATAVISDGKEPKNKKKVLYVIIAAVVLLIAGLAVVFGVRSGGQTSADSDIHRRDSLKAVALALENEYLVVQNELLKAEKEKLEARSEAEAARVNAENLRKIADRTGSKQDIEKANAAEAEAQQKESIADQKDQLFKSKQEELDDISTQKQNANEEVDSLNTIINIKTEEPADDSKNSANKNVTTVQESAKTNNENPASGKANVVKTDNNTSTNSASSSGDNANANAPANSIDNFLDHKFSELLNNLSLNKISKVCRDLKIDCERGNKKECKECLKYKYKGSNVSEKQEIISKMQEYDTGKK